MARTSNDVNISNSERAAVVNKAHSDVFLRIHAKGSDNISVQGVMTISQTKDNPTTGICITKGSTDFKLGAGKEYYQKNR